MKHMDEHLESRIVRSLDGELGEDERLELDRELIRNPEAHRLRDDYAAVDRLAAAALNAYVSEPVCPPETLGPQRTVRLRLWSHWSRGWLAVSGAVAAALLAMVIPAPFGDAPVTPPTIVGRDGISPADSSLVHPVSSTPVLQRATGRDLMGVVGEDGNIYFIEVERTRTIRLPNGRFGLQGNEL
jgi:anti-sigma factor RsiW